MSDKRANLLISIVALLTPVVGCGSEPKPQPRLWDATTQSVTTEQPLPSIAQPTTVTQGAAPLVYLAQSGGLFTVLDVTSNQELCRTTVGAKQIISIDSSRGVRINETVIRPGPLSSDHKYSIVLQPDLTNRVRTERISPNAQAPVSGHGSPGR